MRKRQMSRIDVAAIAFIIGGGIVLKVYGLALESAISWAGGAAIVGGIGALVANASGRGSIWDLKRGSDIDGGT